MENPLLNNPQQPNPQQPNPQPNPNPNTNSKGEQDRNAQIIAHLASLRRLSSSIRGGGRLRDSLADYLDTITNTISDAQGSLYNITSYRESRRQYYFDGLTHKDIKALKLQKTSYFHYSETLAPDWFHPPVKHAFP